MLKINGKLSVILTYAGSLLFLGALLIYTILPTSELANSIEYSGTDALWILATCPVLALIGTVCFMAALVKDLKAWQSYISKELFTGAAAGIAVGLVAGFAMYLSNFLTQLSLGFVAPFTGTIYETYAVILTMITIDMFILSTFAAIAIKRNNK